MLYSSISDIGRVRSSNQDTVFATDQPVGQLSNLYIVADGMGGHKAGEFASAESVRRAVADIERCELKEPIAVLEDAITAANQFVYYESEADPNKKGMGTTFVAATIKGQHLYVANVGDSRLYLVDPTGMCQITRDHSLVEEMLRRGEMTEEMAEHAPNRNVITRAIGAEPQVKIDFFDLFLQPSEQVLLCSDGLTNMVNEDEIFYILNNTEDIKERAKKLVLAANANGGRDNISVVVVEPLSDEERV